MDSLASCMSPENQEEERVMAEAILNHLAHCPGAMDAEEGIAWSLMRQQAKVVAQTVTKVLNNLIKTGRIEPVPASKRTQYRLKP